MYLLELDYFSQWINLALLDYGTKSDDVILHLISMFAKFGIPNELVSDGFYWFSSFTFRKFAE